MKDYKRSFMFLNLFDNEVPAALVVFDNVTSSNALFEKKWLLHGIEEPEINGNRTIYRRTYNDAKNNMAYNGKLTNDTLIPSPDNMKVEKVGGEGKEFYYEGTNYFGYDNGNITDEGTGWRIEVSPKKESETDYFLNVMQVSDNDKDYYREVSKIETDSIAGAVIADRVVTFSKSGEAIGENVSFSVSGEGLYKYTLADMKAGTWSISAGGENISAVSSEEGRLLSFEAPAGEVVCTYSQEGGVKEFINTSNPEMDVISIRYNERFVYSDVPAVIIDDRTLVPMRAIFERFGAKLDYNGETSTATATLGDRVVVVSENDKTAYVDGQAVELDVPAMILNDRFVVPVRFISESFGATVDWDEKAKTVFITPSKEILISKVEQEGYAKIKTVNASAFNAENYDYNVLDLDLTTLWAAEGEQYLEFEFEEEYNIANVEVILNPNSGRSAEFEILYSSDGQRWISVKKYYGDPNGDGIHWEVFDFPKTIKTKHIKYLAKGSDKSMWNGVVEMRFKIAQ